jgi:hypothetical protein
MVSALAARYGVSRQFLYENWRRALGSEACAGTVPFPDEDTLARLMLCLRLFCRSSVQGIVETFAEMGWKPGSAGHISEFLRDVASGCDIQIPENAEPVTLMLDEIFANGCPILVTMEPSSHYILGILLATDRRADTWEAELVRLQNLGVNIGLLVKDQGIGLKAAAQRLGLPERADLFHLLKPFDPFLPSLERRAYGAIGDEYDRLRVFCNRKTEKSLELALARCEEAAAEARRAVRDFDAFDYLHRSLHEAFDSFTGSGELRTRKSAEADIGAALDLTEELFGERGKIIAAVKFLRGNLEDYWSYFEQLEDIVRRYAGKMPAHVLMTACLAWQAARKSMAVKSPQKKKEQKGISGCCMQSAMAGAGAGLKNNISSLLRELDSNVRSSSPLEAVNSVIRDSLNSCRGQVTQATLTMLAFHINHKKAARGKYKGTSPYERLTGKTEDVSSIAQLIGQYRKRLGKKSVYPAGSASLAAA